MSVCTEEVVAILKRPYPQTHQHNSIELCLIYFFFLTEFKTAVHYLRGLESTFPKALPVLLVNRLALS